MAIDFVAGAGHELGVGGFHVDREVEVGVHAGGGDFVGVHDVGRAAGKAEPAGMAVEGGDGVATLGVCMRETRLSGAFAVDFDGVGCGPMPVSVPFCTRLVIFWTAEAPPTAAMYLSRIWFGVGRRGLGVDDGIFAAGQAGLRFFVADDRDADGMRGAAVAGVAGDFFLAFEIVFVDGVHHFDHFAGGELGLLVVFVEDHLVAVADVAVLAVDAERGGDELHGGEDLLGGDAFEDFDVFELLLGEFGRAAGGSLGMSGEEGEAERESCESERRV